jgi:tetratricopeptide (TPR) repeat protein
VFAKLERPARPAPARSPPEPVEGRRFGWVDAALALAGALSIAVIWSRWAAPPTSQLGRTTAPAAEATPRASSPAPRSYRAAKAPTRGATPEASGGAAPATALEPVAPRLAPGPGGGLPPTLPGGQAPAPDLELSSADQQLLGPLLILIGSGGVVEESHLRQAEELHGRHPRTGSVRRTLETLLELAAQQARAGGRPFDAVRYRARATELWPDEGMAWLRLIQHHEGARAWREAEAVARRGIPACPDEPALDRALATALMQQGRDDEAADVLRRLLARRDDGPARSLLARLEAQLGSFAGLARRGSSHFSVRFEGEADDALGQALLQTLEEKHELLSRTLGFEPQAEIQVILYPRQTFKAVSSAPGWAGGYYSHYDGRIRIGTRDLSAGFVPLDLERTLTHELTHAFLAWRTRGATPDDINEGLAQYLSGRRLGYRLAASRAVVRDGRMKVDDFYDSALSFVEYLVDRYRQAAMNDLIDALGTTGDVDAAFRRAYRQSYAETREEWLKQLQ